LKLASLGIEFRLALRQGRPLCIVALLKVGKLRLRAFQVRAAGQRLRL